MRSPPTHPRARVPGIRQAVRPQSCLRRGNSRTSETQIRVPFMPGFTAANSRVNRDSVQKRVHALAFHAPSLACPTVSVGVASPRMGQALFAARCLEMYSITTTAFRKSLSMPQVEDLGLEQNIA